MLEVKDKVQRYLLDLGDGIQVTENGYTFRYGSTRVFVDVRERGEGEDEFTTVMVWAPFVKHLKPSPELFEYVARNADSFLFGHLGLIDHSEQGTLTLVFSHTVLGDYLDPAELQAAVVAVAGTADSHDDELAAKFGGNVYFDED